MRYTEAPACIYVITNEKTAEAYVGAASDYDAVADKNTDANEVINKRLHRLGWGKEANVHIHCERWYWNTTDLYGKLVLEAWLLYVAIGYTIVNKRRPVAYYDSSFLGTE